MKTHENRSNETKFRSFQTYSWPSHRNHNQSGKKENRMGNHPREMDTIDQFKVKLITDSLGVWFKSVGRQVTELFNMTFMMDSFFEVTLMAERFLRCVAQIYCQNNWSNYLRWHWWQKGSSSVLFKSNIRTDQIVQGDIDGRKFPQGALITDRCSVQTYTETNWPNCLRDIQVPCMWGSNL